MVSKIIINIKEKAEQLYTLRKAIALKEEQNREEILVLKETRDALQDALLKSFNTQGLQSIKVGFGDVYVGTSKSLLVTNPISALKWAMENYAVKIDKNEVKKKFKDIEQIPGGFEFEEKQFIGVRKKI